jgi:hypothetical protein
MNDKNLDEIWKEMTKESFEAFIEAHVGYKDDATRGRLPSCFGSGDNRHWCFNCALVRVC